MKKNFPTPGEPSRRGTGDYGDVTPGRTEEMEHPDHGGVVGRHRGRGHYDGKALDLGGYGNSRDYRNAKDQDYMWPYITRFLKIYGLSPSFLPQVLHAEYENYGPKYSGGPDGGHNDHLHVEFGRGGFVRGITKAIMGERGVEFVLDNDTTRALDDNYPGLLEA